MDAVITNRPLVSFALIAYNQAEFVREAIEAAFAQTYHPLEIVLSDDCSSDETFEVMQKVAASYSGPHKIILRRNDLNLGTTLNVQNAFRETSGDLFVLGAGDDISMKNRVETLVDCWIAAGAPEGCVHSGRETFRNGQTVSYEPVASHQFSDHILEGFAQGYWLPAAAPTCAFTRGVFEKFGPLLGGSIIEDAPLQLRAALIGSFIACDYPLVRQRLHAANTGTGYNICTPARWNRFMRSKMIAFHNMLMDLAHCKNQIDQKLVQRIESRILTVIRSASGLVLPEIRPIRRFERARLAFKLLISPAVARSPRLRLEYMFSFFNFSFHLMLKRKLLRLIRLDGK